jgi:16S rRNA (guanine(966)-N(2))-methyltransferase RsmD
MSRGSAPHEVRIIGGQWKRSKLPVADKPGLRPTPDRVRETLFNWLGQDLTGWRCLDAFAGSGTLGFEAASRGATEVLMLERDPQLVQALCASALRLKAQGLRVEQADALSWMKRETRTGFDLVFIDPPFDAGLFEPALAASRGTLSEGGLVYLESPTAWTGEQLAPLGFNLLRQSRAGAVHFHLLQLGPR